MKTYQVIQKNTWANPNMLIFVDESGMVVGHRLNPNNSMTESWAEEGEDWGFFSPEDYESCHLVEEVS